MWLSPLVTTTTPKQTAKKEKQKSLINIFYYYYLPNLFLALHVEPLFQFGHNRANPVFSNLSLSLAGIKSPCLCWLALNNPSNNSSCTMRDNTEQSKKFRTWDNKLFLLSYWCIKNSKENTNCWHAEILGMLKMSFLGCQKHCVFKSGIEKTQ